jgi:hypothetical protein
LFNFGDYMKTLWEAKISEYLAAQALQKLKGNV